MNMDQSKKLHETKFYDALDIVIRNKHRKDDEIVEVLSVQMNVDKTLAAKYYDSIINFINAGIL